MFRLDADKPVHFCDGLTRRDFLHAGMLGMMGFALTDWMALKAQGAVAQDNDLNVIQLFLVGGPYGWTRGTAKPEAPAEIRGPYSNQTNVPGIEICGISSHGTDRRQIHAGSGLYHTAAAVHDTDTNSCKQDAISGNCRRIGSVLAWKKGGEGCPPHVLKPIGNTGGIAAWTEGRFSRQTYDPFVLNARPSIPTSESRTCHRTTFQLFARTGGAAGANDR
jgi:hypothetical protein